MKGRLLVSSAPFVLMIFLITLADRAALPAENAAPVPAKDGQTRRVRELIYILRQHRVFDREDEWAEAIRELVTIGKPALPELVAELDATNRDQTLRALGFTLRAIDDPRAVPALIRAIPKTLRAPASDCGVRVHDPALNAFMQKHDRSPRNDDTGDMFKYGRPVNEIFEALSHITGHREPPNGERDPLRHVSLWGDQRQQGEARRLFAERQDHWEIWWADNWQEFVTQDELDSVKPTARTEDLVEKAGLAKFGPTFPTGPDVRLGPVIEVVLRNGDEWDAKSHLDLDTGYLYEYLEGVDDVDGPPSTARTLDWFEKNGIDVRHHGGLDGQDLHAWLIDNQRWDTMDDEVGTDRPLDMGREAGALVPFGKDRRDFQYDRVGTFLFTTREGSRGIMQVDPASDNPLLRSFRYRLWLTEDEPRFVATTVPPGGRKRTVTRMRVTFQTVTMPLPGRGHEFLLDLESGESSSPPLELTPPDTKRTSPFDGAEPLVTWCREQDIELSTYQFLRETSSGTNPDVGLIGLDLRTVTVSPQAFLLFGGDDVQEIMNRWRPQQPWFGDMSPHSGSNGAHIGRDTFGFQTKDGKCGLLQIIKTSKDPPSITFRYRLLESSEPIP